MQVKSLDVSVPVPKVWPGNSETTRAHSHSSCPGNRQIIAADGKRRLYGSELTSASMSDRYNFLDIFAPGHVRHRGSFTTTQEEISFFFVRLSSSSSTCRNAEIYQFITKLQKDRPDIGSRFNHPPDRTERQTLLPCTCHGINIVFPW